MGKVTLALDDETIKAARQYARRHHTTLDSLVRRLVHQACRPESGDWVDECFQLMDKARIPAAAPRKWKRTVLYRGAGLLQ